MSKAPRPAGGLSPMATHNLILRSERSEQPALSLPKGLEGWAEVTA
jgi:hypothetical protein